MVPRSPRFRGSNPGGASLNFNFLGLLKVLIAIGALFSMSLLNFAAKFVVPI